MRQIKISQQITNRDSNALQRYLQEISRIPLLTMDEEIELAQRIHQGDQEALRKLVNANLRFVVSVAKQYQGSGMNLLDLIEEGNMGLLRAARKFDETRGFKFISYAVWWIRQAMLQSLAENGHVVRVPLNQVNQQTKLQKLITQFEQQEQRQPSVAELAMMLDMPEERVQTTLVGQVRQTSVDAPFAEGEDGSLLDVMVNTTTPATDSTVQYEGLRFEMRRSLNQLNEREREIVRLSFGIGCREKTLDEISAMFDLSQERVRQIREKAIRRLRGRYSANLRPYL
ncbi:MAG: RNA polymerase sigma factor RpoD/SigA [Muribaculaceae bacterium]|nr:RNA polymerase sigma factor RpoD/SigA [Muribaculaceae bacterium]